MKLEVYFPFSLTAVFTKIKHQITGRACVRVSVFVRQMVKEAAGRPSSPLWRTGVEFDPAAADATGRRERTETYPSSTSLAREAAHASTRCESHARLSRSRA